jgi:transcriptional regulator with XRE-family HTH domain
MSPKKKKPIYAINFHFLRNQLRMTREEMAEKLGIPLGTWGSYEEGRAFPHHEKLPRICEALEFNDLLALITIDLTQRKENAPVTELEAKDGLLKVRKFIEGLKNDRLT